MNTRFYGAVIGCLLVLCAGIPAVGQLTSAHLGGNITDETGRVVPGAQVTITSVQTGLEQTTTSNPSGEYQFPIVPPGSYSMKVVANGFKTHVQNGIVLRVNQPATLDVRLTIGATTTTVTVTGGASQMNTISPQISQTLSHAEIADLPLNGRDPSSLVFLAPTTFNEFFSDASTPVGEGFNTETSASSTGGRQGTDWYLLDGVSNNDTFGLEAVPFPNADATDQFRAIVNLYPAKYGFARSGIVSISTRSGTNQFHGGLFEFVRNNDVNAKNWFSGAVDPLHRNQFGGYIGGPILRNKLFFFTNIQLTRDNSASTADTSYVPTAAMLNGDFSAVPSSALNGPLAPSVFKTVNGKPNQVDPKLFSPGALQIETMLPRGGDPSSGFIRFQGLPSKQTYSENTSRIDYNLNANHRVFLRSYLYNNNQAGLNEPTNLLVGQNGFAGTYLSLAAGDTWTVSPTMVNSATVSWQELNVDTGFVAKGPNGQPFCLSQTITVAEPACYFAGFSVNNGQVLYGAGQGFSLFGSAPEITNRRYYEIVDSFTKIIGNHTIEGGFDLFHRYMFNDEIGGALPNPSFDGQFTGSAMADFLLGYMSSYSQGAGMAGATNGWMQGYYVQDRYQAKPTLTLTLGLRWEPFVPPGIVAGRGADFVSGQQSTRYPNAPLGMVFPGDKGISNALFASSYGYWMPRLGIAWQPKSNWAVRAGFGMFTMSMEDAFYRAAFFTAPFSPDFSLNAGATTPLSFDTPWASLTSNGGKSPFPPFAGPSEVPPPDTTFLTPVDMSGVFQPDLKLGLTQSWNFSVDRQFGKDWEVHAGYVGSATFHMATTVEQNPGNFQAGNARTKYPDFSSILQVQDGGTARYNALVISVDKRISRGLQFHSNYTFSESQQVGGSGDPSFESSVSDPFDIKHDYGNSSLNIPNIWTFNFVYQFPLLHNASWITKGFANGWVLSGLETWESGRPFTLNGGQGRNNSGFNIGQDRADVVPGQPWDVRKGPRSHWLNQYFNTAAFVTNAPGTPGNSPQYLMNSSPDQNADLAILKNTRFHERYNVQLRVEAYNAFNHPSFAPPGTTVDTPNFGQITSIGPFQPRVMQGGIKFTF